MGVVDVLSRDVDNAVVTEEVVLLEGKKVGDI